MAPHPPPRSRRPSRLEGAPAASRRGLRLPIAIKFAVLIALLVLGFMVWLTATAMQVAEESQDFAVNESGIKDVSGLASNIDPAWIQDPKQRVRLSEFLRRYYEASRDLGVLNAVVYSTVPGEALATGKLGQESIKISERQTKVESPLAVQQGVEIQELEAFDGKPARRFTKQLSVAHDGRKEPLGRVEVVLSAQRIHQARDATRDRMIMVTGASCLVAAAVSFLLARFLTIPIRALARDLRQVSLGNLDHQSRVRSGDEMGDLAATFNQMTAHLRQAQEALVAQKALEYEMNLATRIQTRLLPAEIPAIPGFEIGAYYKAAREVGGDYYDFIRIDGDHLGIVVADVSGKGVPGSLVMTMTRSLLRMAAAGRESPAETVCQVNRILAPDVNPGMFVTLVYLVLHIPTRRLRLVRAGHNAPVLHVARLGKLLHLQPRGIALGLDAQGSLFERELEVQQFTLRPGDFLTLYTDGIVEGKDPRGETYTDERFARVLLSSASGGAGAIIDSVMADLEKHRQGAEQSDDITLIVLKGAGEG